MKTKNILLSMVVLAGSLSWGGASASSSHAEMRAYYVDPGSSVYQSGKIIAIDVAKMKVYKSIDYPEYRNLSGINKAGETKNLYVSDYLNRSAGYLPASDHKQNSIQIMDARSVSFKGSIELPESPAISPMAYNTHNKYVLVAAKNKAISSIIDPSTNKVLASTAGSTGAITHRADNHYHPVLEMEIDDGFEAVDYRYYSDGLETVDHGDYSDGSLFDLQNGPSSGAPFWFTRDTFAVIDRKRHSISLYKMKQKAKSNGRGVKTSVEFLSKVKTPTPVHSFVNIRDNSKGTGTYYAVAEGLPKNNIPPMLLEITINGGNKIHIKRTQSLPGDPKNMESSYYADVHPDGKHIYIGSSTKSTKGANVGYMHVINRDNMKIVSTIKTGFGSARTTFIPKRGLAIVTNTKDSFVTVIDTKTHKKIKDVDVTSRVTNKGEGKILQSVTTFVDSDQEYFYSSAAYFVNYNGHAEGRPINSIFYKLNLKDLEIHNKLPLEEHIYELEGVFAPISPVISHTMKGEISVALKPIKRTTGDRSSAFVGGSNTIGAPTKMIWGVGVFTRFAVELKDKDGKPHKVHLVANLRIDGKRCWGLKIPINSAITCANKPKNKLANKLHIAFDSTLNKDLVKNFAGTRLTGNFSLKRSQWKNAGHALSSEMHEFAVDWIVPAKVVNHTINGDISIDIKPIKRTTGHKSSAFVGGFNTIGVPTKMVWASSAVSTKFSVILHVHDKHNSAAYKVHLVADITSKLGCGRMIINSAATCSKRYEEPYNGLDISFDKALNKSLPSGITLKGHFSLKRLQWPHMNTTNLEMHNFEVNWKVPPH